MARELQFRLLPQSLPQLKNLEIAAKFSPARAIGGDLYDFVNYSLIASPLLWATSAAKARRQRFMRRWSAEFCAPTLPLSLRRPKCCPP